MRVERILDKNTFFAMKDQWRTLLENSGQCSVFLTHEWLYSWWEMYGTCRELFILTCYDNESGRLVGIFPGFIRKRWGFLRAARFLGSENAGSDFLEIIAVPTHEVQVYDAVLEYLFSHPEEWDIMEISDILDSSPLVRRLVGDGLLRPYCRISAKRTVCPYIALSGDWNEYLDRLSKKSRGKLLYERRKLCKQFKVNLQDITDASGLLEAFPHIVRLHQVRRTSKGDEGVFGCHEFSLFLQSACTRLLESGLLQLTFLELNGEKVAFLLTMKCGESIYYYQSGLDVSYAKYSVGYLLLGYLVERAIGEGLATFEFLRGDEKYKYEWTAETRNMMALFLYNRNLVGKTLKMGATAYFSIKAFVKRVIKGGNAG